MEPGDVGPGNIRELQTAEGGQDVVPEIAFICGLGKWLFLHRCVLCEVTFGEAGEGRRGPFLRSC